MKGFEDFDPHFDRGSGRFIALNVSIGIVVALIAADWLTRVGLVLAWGVVRTLLSWLRDTHRLFVARVMARGEHGAINPVVAHYLAVLVASMIGAGFGVLATIMVRRLVSGA
ncbi:MAG TPA: hypothetical protein VJW73_14240 [Gemmatimonadaceae bacterium]|nr:hypothetical protein [Gemmatimonadaceae bacterium]